LLCSCIERSREAQLSSVVLVTHGDTIRIALAWLESCEAHQITEAVPTNGSVTTVSLVDGALAGRRTVVPALNDPRLVTDGNQLWRPRATLRATERRAGNDLET
jgi:broad specificity phosphatase PhoE